MKKDKYDTYCSVCGLAITKHQIGVCIEEPMLFDFNDRCYTDLSIHICYECWEKIKVYTRDGMKKAIKRSEKLKVMKR